METTQEIKFVDTEKDVQARIDKRNCICDSCGGKLDPMRTVDNFGSPTHWIGCRRCGYFTYGVKKEIYEIAWRFVDSGYVHYDGIEISDNSSPQEMIFWRERQIRGACEVVIMVLLIAKQNIVARPSSLDAAKKYNETFEALSPDASWERHSDRGKEIEIEHMDRLLDWIFDPQRGGNL